MQTFYNDFQKDETIVSYGTRLEQTLSRAVTREHIEIAAKDSILRSKFWTGLRSQQLKNSTRHLQDSSIDFKSLLRDIRKNESEDASYLKLVQKQKAQQQSSQVETESKEDKILKQLSDLIDRVKSMERRLEDQQQASQVEIESKENKILKQLSDLIDRVKSMERRLEDQQQASQVETESKEDKILKQLSDLIDRVKSMERRLEDQQQASQVEIESKEDKILKQLSDLIDRVKSMERRLEDQQQAIASSGNQSSFQRQSQQSQRRGYRNYNLGNFGSGNLARGGFSRGFGRGYQHNPGNSQNENARGSFRGGRSRGGYRDGTSGRGASRDGTLNRSEQPLNSTSSVVGRPEEDTTYRSPESHPTVLERMLGQSN